MSALLEREHAEIVAELERVRGLLESYRDGEPSVDHEPREADGFEPAVDRLTRVLGLSPFERELLLLAAAVELDGGIAAIVSELQRGEPRPTFGLAMAALPGAHWDALAPRSPLRRWRLLERLPGATLASRPLRVDERVLHHLTGIDWPDERLDGTLRVAVGFPALSRSQLTLAQELARTSAAAKRIVVRLDGEDADGQVAVARALALALGRVALVIRGAALPAAGPELSALTRLIDREVLMLGGLPILDGEGAHESVLRAFIDELDAPVAALVGETDARAPSRATLHRSVLLPSPPQQRELWTAALGEPLAGALAQPIDELAQHFRLGVAAVEAVASELLATTEPGASAGVALRRLCREHSRVRLEGLAERIDPVATWDDLVLPAGHTGLLHDLVRQVRHRVQVYERWGFGAGAARGLGVTALFAGESGTGKTLAAEVIAHELGLDLYRIDLAATVSKYIGETEKNLRKLFAAAEASGAVLLFDEADALFGKRGEVKDGHDRYANLEVAYLLQRMESYRGLAILTTNLRSNVDRAFLRRLRFVVQFPFPDAHLARGDLAADVPGRGAARRYRRGRARPAHHLRRVDPRHRALGRVRGGGGRQRRSRRRTCCPRLGSSTRRRSGR